ncbi:Flagellar biosynthesis protein fliO [Enterobacter cancerogenus]|uniref:flagellar biosynthetic protein FliO n=1 Tax=Enterobacter cancerogenus TaxID=69218 RepID=UPI001928A2F9|nr:flagellar biosynthetic protein FliO [Enterobacter cancerogenus]CAD5358399.1 Flagellar biosynthesis protein fliO [Enterobacter cancerogenus]
MQPANTSLTDLSAPGSLLFSVGAVLALLIVAIAVTVWLLRRIGFAGNSGGMALISVKHLQSLGAKGQLMIVEVEDRWLLLGVTAESINCLTTLTKPEDTGVCAATVTNNFQAALSWLLKKQPVEQSR